MLLTIIAAMDNGRLIGDGNRLPWHLPADLAHFKKLTMGSAVLMGRKTYDSIGKPLPGRTNIVISGGVVKFPGCKHINGLDKLSFLPYPQVYVMGGASLYAQTIPLADKMELTLINGEFTGDTWFPDYDEDDWSEVSRSRHNADEKNKYSMEFVSLVRKS